MGESPYVHETGAHTCDTTMVTHHTARHPSRQIDNKMMPLHHQLPESVLERVLDMLGLCPPWRLPTYRLHATPHEAGITVTTTTPSSVVIPPDHNRRQPILDIIDNCLLQRVFHFRRYVFEIVSSSDLTLLDPIRHTVQAITLDPCRFKTMYDTSFSMVPLSRFPHLTHLTLHSFASVVDMVLVAQRTPHLTTLVLQDLTVDNLPLALPKWLNLQELVINEVAGVTSFTIAHRLPKLQSLSLSARKITDVDQLARVAPLKSLIVAGEWDAPLDQREAAVRPHLDTLETLSTQYTQQQWCVSWLLSHGPRLSSVYVVNDDGGVDVLPPTRVLAHQLMCLRLGIQSALHDVTPLSQLVSLTELQVVVRDRDVDCRPLRALQQLRVIVMSRGRVMEFVPWLPFLDTLHCIDDDFPERSYSAQFSSRMFDVEPQHKAPSDGTTASDMLLVRRLVLQEGVFLSDSVAARLPRVDQLEIINHSHPDLALTSTSSLGSLKRIAIRDRYPRLDALPTPPAWLQSLEEFHMTTEQSLEYGFSHKTVIPPWMANASRLTTVGLLWIDRPEMVKNLPSCVECLYLPMEDSYGKWKWRLRDFKHLTNLRVISIPYGVSCCKLRHWRDHTGRRQLHSLLHPTKDCLGTDHRWAGSEQDYQCCGLPLRESDTFLPPWSSCVQPGECGEGDDVEYMYGDEDDDDDRW